MFLKHFGIYETFLKHGKIEFHYMNVMDYDLVRI